MVFTEETIIVKVLTGVFRMLLSIIVIQQKKTIKTMLYKVMAFLGMGICSVDVTGNDRKFL